MADIIKLRTALTKVPFADGERGKHTPPRPIQVKQYSTPVNYKKQEYWLGVKFSL